MQTNDSNMHHHVGPTAHLVSTFMQVTIAQSDFLVTLRYPQVVFLSVSVKPA
jgi:hypothetical protein